MSHTKYILKIILSYAMFATSAHAVYIDYNDQETGRSIAVSLNQNNADDAQKDAIKRGVAKLFTANEDISLDITTWAEQSRNGLGSIMFFDVTDANSGIVKGILKALSDRDFIQDDTTVSVYGLDNKEYTFK